ncbi:MAG: sensor histidine kinase [Treponema sp.]
MIFAYSTAVSVVVFHYTMLLFSFSLWIKMVRNKKMVHLYLIFFIGVSTFFDKSIVFFVPLVLITAMEYWYEGILQLKDTAHMLIMPIAAFLLLVYSVILHGNLIFFMFTLIVFFYTGMKVYYRFHAQQLILLQDNLSEYRLMNKKRRQQLQNDMVKNTEVAILEERNRISVELHNSIGHTISAGILQLHALQYITHDEATQHKLALLQHSLEQGMVEIRECLHNMHNESFHLEYALQELIQKMPLLIALTYNIDTLPYLLKHDIFSIIKECMTNTVKYSGASTMAITMTEHPFFYSITVQDNGIGCDAAEAKNHGIGLIVMEETIKKHGGSIRFYSDSGFKIHIIFPKGGVPCESSHS